MRTQFLELGLLTLAVTAQQSSTPPSIALDWGTWQSQVDASDTKLYAWSNVRFADEPPRFGKSSFPKGHNPASTVDACIQPQRGNSAADIPRIHVPGDGVPQGEDCLGLDIYAPVDNFDDNGQPIDKLPVVVWIYGGGFIFGSKRQDPSIPLYTGQSIVAAAGYKAVYVAGNYRLGALG